MIRPQYEALDVQGLPYLRLARVVGELPTPDVRLAALVEATAAIAEKTGLNVVKRIPFGAPVFTAFEGMNRPKAKHHVEFQLLLTMGDEVSLDYCQSYN
ncbi:MAG: hypothetical protein Q7U28_09210 [Aquabacterium sp.]|nr:hypothetical protein [Aquabacterium sp.]